jgi:hypothetical protein
MSAMVMVCGCPPAGGTPDVTVVTGWDPAVCSADDTTNQGPPNWRATST